MALIVFVLALALASGLQSAVAGDSPIISTFPINIDGQVIQIQTLPAFIEPIPENVVPEPEVEAVIPELITINPCDSCFEYMTNLIGQLTDSTLPQPHPMPEVEVIPEDDIIGILPHPMPEVEVIPENEIVGIVPHPMPQVEVVPQISNF